MASSTSGNPPLSYYQQQRQPQHQHQQQPPLQPQHALSRTSSLRRSSVITASTPDLSSLYSAHSRLGPAAHSLARQASLAALTPGSLATIPDDTESYALHTVLSDNHSTSRAHKMLPPMTPRKGPGPFHDFAVGDQVDVPGSMTGTIRFVGSVAGRKGTFAGVELHQEFAFRGKNSGDVDGVSYFATSTPGSGIFVPINKVFKRDVPASFPHTPSGPPSSGLRVVSHSSTALTPPTPSLPVFSQSVGPSRVPSPQGKRSRPSLARPESPARKLQLAPAPRPSIATPAKPPSRYGSPTGPRFTSSVRGTAGDPNKLVRLDRKPSLVQRSASALGQPIPNFDDDDEEETGSVLASTCESVHEQEDSLGPITSSLGFKRPASRAKHATDEEIERLKSQLEERDRQLKEQASALAEMESSLSELTVLIDQTESRNRSNSLDGKDTSQLRAMLREKNEKIALLTAEFDAHRADFRSTIDTLEMASTETQRVYDARIMELEQELQDLHERQDDVENVARQLKQLEELVQELEDGLRDARGGEAEARGEVEFLRGEVERTRSELRREREKSSTSTNGNTNTEDRASMSKELEKKEDEIRGLKAIIHSLSRDSIPGSESPEKASTQLQRTNSLAKSTHESADNRASREKLEREVAELRSLVESMTAREEELEREVETLRRQSAIIKPESPIPADGADRSSHRDSKVSVTTAREVQTPDEPQKHHQTLLTTSESDEVSSATETSTLWCEICEASGHDILTCTNMFGAQNEQGKANADATTTSDKVDKADKVDQDAAQKSRRNSVSHSDAEAISRPMSPVRPKASMDTISTAGPNLTNLHDSGPLAGKESGIVDPSKWCAMCERDGHDSIDCPLEDAF